MASRGDSQEGRIFEEEEKESNKLTSVNLREDHLDQHQVGGGGIIITNIFRCLKIVP